MIAYNMFSNSINPHSRRRRPLTAACSADGPQRCLACDLQERTFNTRDSPPRQHRSKLRSSPHQGPTSINNGQNDSRRRNLFRPSADIVNRFAPSTPPRLLATRHRGQPRYSALVSATYFNPRMPLGTGDRFDVPANSPVLRRRLCRHHRQQFPNLAAHLRRQRHSARQTSNRDHEDLAIRRPGVVDPVSPHCRSWWRSRTGGDFLKEYA